MNISYLFEDDDADLQFVMKSSLDKKDTVGDLSP